MFWLTDQFDRSCAEIVWVPEKTSGRLARSLLNTSYGHGKIYVVPFEKVNGQGQGGMCALPIPTFPTEIMRPRFHPEQGHLYVCDMYAWAGNQTQPVKDNEGWAIIGTLDNTIHELGK